MKTINTRLVGFFVVILMSVGSYIFLQSVSLAEGTGEGNAVELKLQQNLQEQAETEEASQTVLPEVELLKFVIETGKRFLPAS